MTRAIGCGACAVASLLGAAANRRLSSLTTRSAPRASRPSPPVHKNTSTAAVANRTGISRPAISIRLAEAVTPLARVAPLILSPTAIARYHRSLPCESYREVPRLESAAYLKRRDQHILAAAGEILR